MKCYFKLNELLELTELTEKVEAISTKGLTKGLINKFSILNGAKYGLILL